jgi:NaMN:DMB phosphoribosyltransferase
MRLDEILGSIEPLDLDWVERARERTARLVMPFRALGKLHEISEKLCGIQQTLELSVQRKALLVMAGDHGVVAEGVSAYPQEVTREMVKTFLRGGAGINALARHVGADPHDPEQNIAAGTALLRELLLKYENDPNPVRRALAAYNAGPGAVSKYNGVPPYRETQQYVEKVLERYWKLVKAKPSSD